MADIMQNKQKYLRYTGNKLTFAGLADSETMTKLVSGLAIAAVQITVLGIGALGMVWFIRKLASDK